jgi:phage terminase small subunit
MTPKQARFVAEYLVDLNATQAAIRAGYSRKTANVVGPRLLVNVGISAAIKAGQRAQLDAADLTAKMVIDRLRILGFQDIRRLFDRAGNLLPIHELPTAAAAMIGGIDVVIRNVSPNDDHTDTVHKIKLIDPVKPLELLARKFGLLIDKVEVTVHRAEARVAILEAARKRVGD